MNRTHLLTTLILCTIACTSCTGRNKKETPKIANSVVKEEGLLGNAIHMPDLINALNAASPLEAFDKALKSYDNIVVDFYAEWCAPCRRLGPVVHDIAQSNNNILFIKLDIDAYQTIAGKYGVRSIPTMLFFKKGTQVLRKTGYHSSRDLEAILETTFKK